MSLIRLTIGGDLLATAVVVAFDGWIDSGSAATAAADHLATGGEDAGAFEDDLIFDYRARRPTLEIVDGRPTDLTWPQLSLKRRRFGDRDLLILTGPEPDYRWRQLANDVVTMASQLGVQEWISLGAIPAAVPHTRPVPILGTESRAGLLRGGIEAGPAGLLRVPSAAVSVLDLAVARAGIATVGYYAQVPHYVSGSYPAASMELLKAVGHHVAGEMDLATLGEEARQLRARLDGATALDDDTRSYVERLEAMVDEARLPSGDELISDIERFLRDRGTESGQRP